MGDTACPRGACLQAVLTLILLALPLAAMAGCAPPQVFTQTNDSREGHILNRKVAVVYSLQYHINMGGFEKLHPHPQKYGKLYLQLVTDGYIKPEDVFVPKPVTREQILTAHSEEFLRSLKDSAKIAAYTEMPILAIVPNGLVDAGLLRAFRWQAGGTLMAGRLAIKHGIGISLGGGHHHACRDHGEGFCVYNDLAIAIGTLQKEGLIKRAMVVDLDVHQGNGTAEIFAGDDSVFTFSMHEDDIYPIPKATSDLDIELSAETGDEEYLAKLRAALPKIFADARPDIVFLQGGADVLDGDPLANLCMTPDGLVKRDAMVIDECVRRGIPVVTTMGGGYSPDSWLAQYKSIRRTLKKYGAVAGKPKHPPREATAEEKSYTK